jgi:hypothetical protein
MRWLLPNSSQVRHRRIFAWRPIEIENYRVWLEFYEVEEMYIMDRWVIQRKHLIHREI